MADVNLADDYPCVLSDGASHSVPDFAGCVLKDGELATR